MTANEEPQPEPSPGPVDEGGVESAGGRPQLSVVALDDDPDFREYVRDVLEAEGHEVRVAADPDECHRLCEQRLPDVLLLDIKMGKRSGEQALEEIRRRWPKLCVVVVTGYPSLETMRRTFKQDVYDYLEKPFSLDELRGVLHQAAARFDLGRSPQARLKAELGRQVRLARTGRGWTLKELSDASGISVSQLSSVERGAHLPSLESLLAISQALNERPSKWLDGAGF